MTTIESLTDDAFTWATAMAAHVRAGDLRAAQVASNEYLTIRDQIERLVHSASAWIPLDLDPDEAFLAQQAARHDLYGDAERMWRE